MLSPSNHFYYLAIIFPSLVSIPPLAQPHLTPPPHTSLHVTPQPTPTLLFTSLTAPTRPSTADTLHPHPTPLHTVTPQPTRPPTLISTLLHLAQPPTLSTLTHKNKGQTSVSIILFFKFSSTKNTSPVLLANAAALAFLCFTGPAPSSSGPHFVS